MEEMNMKNKKISDEDLANKVIDLCLWYQIEETAKQFPDIKKVEFEPEELFQP